MSDRDSLMPPDQEDNSSRNGPSQGRRFVMQRPRFRGWRTVLGGSLAVVLLGSVAAGGLVFNRYEHIVSGLPTVDGLRSYEPPVMSRIYAGDDRVMAALAAERRVFVPITAVPKRVQDAFLAAEDHKFWTHAGVDPLAILRAGLTDVLRGRGHRPIGASTITQQVARIMLLGSNAVSIERKAREALLALRIEQVLPKEKILEIYLNEIYLGNGAYGIGAAAQTYFDKPLDQLDDAEAAFLAALPKSPTNYNPFRYPDAARSRRNTILGEMAELGWISRQAEAEAKAEPLMAKTARQTGPMPGSEWFAESVRRELMGRYGLQQTMEGGLEVHTSLDPALQQVAETALRDGLESYDRGHAGWRGASGHLDGISASSETEVWSKALAEAPAPPGMLPQWRLAVVLAPKTGSVGWRADGQSQTGTILAHDLKWTSSHPLRAGDLVMISPRAGETTVSLHQIPKVEGALVTMDVRTGRVLAMVGGWSFAESQFNRATQALRQPGSSFKPFVYLTAMERGISPSQKFLDSAVSYGDWHPNNYEKDFWGPTTLHDALRESRNLVTIRLAAHIGIKNVADLAQEIGLVDSMPHVLPAALGAVETTVLKEAGAYASIAAGGVKVTPTLIDDVRDRNGNVIWRREGLTLTEAPPQDANGPDAIFPSSDGETETAKADADHADGAPVSPDALPRLKDSRTRITSPESAFQITTMLQDVIRRGTGRSAGVGITHPIAGKTGTSQNFNDAWFAGYSADIVTVVWVGFDTPKTLGKGETGGRIAAPIWNRVMQAALANRPKVDFRMPESLMLVQYDTGMGLAIDAFREDQTPGFSADFTGTAGSGQLTAADTGAENIAGSESDMDDGGATALPGAPGHAESTKTAPAASESGGDIGMGGLY